jgi:ferredoxin-thioredoxin reductase catalytic subunit
VPKATFSKYDQAVAIVEHAKKHGFIINPGTGYGYAMDAIQKFHSCPCDRSRLSCPCEQSVDEVAKQGWCKCHLFWRDYQIFQDTNLPVWKPPENVKP